MAAVWWHCVGKYCRNSEPESVRKMTVRVTPGGMAGRGEAVRASGQELELRFYW